MLRSASLPFILRRSHDVVGHGGITSTRDEIHGLLRLEGGHLVVQWRAARTIDRVGLEIRTDREMGPVREVSLPLSSIAGARVKRAWLRWPPGYALVLNAADLRAFEPLAEEAGVAGLVLEHPAELVLALRHADREPALHFASELRMAVSEDLLKRLEAEEEAAALPGAGEGLLSGMAGEPEPEQERRTARVRE